MLRSCQLSKSAARAWQRQCASIGQLPHSCSTLPFSAPHSSVHHGRHCGPSESSEPGSVMVAVATWSSETPGPLEMASERQLAMCRRQHSRRTCVWCRVGLGDAMTFAGRRH
eukprot:4835291-Prymnesium_polylepis.3